MNIIYYKLNKKQVTNYKCILILIKMVPYIIKYEKKDMQRHSFSAFNEGAAVLHVHKQELKNKKNGLTRYAVHKTTVWVNLQWIL